MKTSRRMLAGIVLALVVTVPASGEEIDLVTVEIPGSQPGEAAKVVACSLFTLEELKQIEGLNFDQWMREEKPGTTVSRCKYVSTNGEFVYVELTDEGSAEAAKIRFDNLQADLIRRHHKPLATTGIGDEAFATCGEGLCAMGVLGGSVVIWIYNESGLVAEPAIRSFGEAAVKQVSKAAAP